MLVVHNLQVHVFRLAPPLAAVLFLILLPGALRASEALPPASAKWGQPSRFDSSNPPPDAYILGAGDKLTLSFVSNTYASLGGSFELLNDGSASLPLVGTVVLEGFTVQQANRWLVNLYRRYLRRPDLTLQVIEARPLQISVVGEVEAPGLYVMSSGGERSSSEGKTGGISSLPTVVAALQKAGGITLNANLRDVRLQRKLPGTSSQLKEIQLDLMALLQKGDKRQNPFLFDGDTILISRAPAPPPDAVLEIAAANLSPASISVNVVGEVKNPGKLQLRAGTPLMQAILAAGAPNPWRANRSDVELVRLNRNGTVTLRRYRVDYSLGVSGPRNPPLREGDSILVNRSVLAAGSDALTAITQPLTGLVNILGLVQILNNTSNNSN